MEKFEIPRVEYRTPDLKVNFRIHRMYVHVQFNSQAEETGKGVGYWATGLLVMLFLASYCNLQKQRYT